MSEGNGLSMQYGEMETELINLTGYVEEFENAIAKMGASVERLCDGWVSEATKTYWENYQATQENLTETAEIVRQIIADNYKYIAAMQATDSSYTGGKVI